MRPLLALRHKLDQFHQRRSPLLDPLPPLRLLAPGLGALHPFFETKFPGWPSVEGFLVKSYPCLLLLRRLMFVLWRLQRASAF